MHAFEPLEASLTASMDGVGSWPRVAVLSALFAGSLAVGLAGLVHYDQWLSRRRATGAAGVDGPRQLALLIATGIGLHNFAEGLAIGQSAVAGETELALVLVVGFALHNGTEGFGIVAPLAGSRPRPSWAFLGALGVIGGGPTVVGTLIGQVWTSAYMEVAFLGLAGGSILYVVIELMNVNRGFGLKPLVTWGLLVGLCLGFGTDLLLGAVGG